MSTTTSAQPVTNPRGIPEAPFVEDVETFAPTRESIAPALQKFQEMIAKYQFMELNTNRRAASLRDKIPDITKTLETVQFLAARAASSASADDDDLSDDGDADPRSITTSFELNDTLYAKATIPTDLKEVYLWLGANVMLSYPVDEAEQLLKDKLRAAKESLRNCEEDLEFLKKQITTLEVNTARLFNHEVTMKRKEREEMEMEERRGKKG